MRWYRAVRGMLPFPAGVWYNDFRLLLVPFEEWVLPLICVIQEPRRDSGLPFVRSDAARQGKEKHS